MAKTIETILNKIEPLLQSLCRVCAAPYIGAVLLYGIWLVQPELLYVVFTVHQWGDSSYADW